MTKVATSRVTSLLAVTASVFIALILGLATALQPLLGVGLFVALYAFSKFIRNGSIAVLAFAGATYFDIVGEYTGAALSPIKLIGGMLILLAILTLMLRSKYSVNDTKNTILPAWKSHPIIVILITIFIAWSIASVAWADNLYQVRTLSTRLITDALIFFAVPVFLNRVEHLRSLAWTLLTCASLSALIGTLMNANVMGRTLGTFTDPNEYAAALVPAIAFAVPIVENSTSTLQRWIGRFLIAYCLLGVMQSGSRGGMLALGVAFVVIIISSRGRERIRLTGISMLGAAVGLSWLVFTPAGSSIFARITDGDSSGRSSLWLVALRQFRSEPLHGIGLGNYPATAYRYLDGISDLDLFLRDPRVVHSTPLELLAELGSVGFLTYYAFVLGCVICAWSALKISRNTMQGELEIVTRGTLAATLSAVASTVFLSGQYQELSWILFSCCLVTLAIAKRGVNALPQDAELSLDAALSDDIKQVELQAG